MQEQLISCIAKLYNLPHLTYNGPVDQGFLSQNHCLSNNGERYFLKQYRYAPPKYNIRQKVAAIHQSKFHFADHGIPAILPYPIHSSKNQTRETFFVWGEHCFALFPFIDGIQAKRGRMPRTALESAGEMLGRLHKAGHNVLDIVPPIKKATFDDRPFWEKSERMLTIIDAKEERSPFDEIAEESLQRKRSLAKQNPPIFQQLGLVDDHLIHGDYHNGNFFINEDGRVSHLFDWEKTEVTAREVELLRSLLFICLQKPDDYRPLLTDESFADAAWYLQSYHAVNPVERRMLEAASQNRLLGNIYSTWVEEEHYLNNNDRVDLFLLGATEMLQYLEAHQKVFTERLVEMIL